MKEEEVLFTCECSSREHQIIMSHDADDNIVYCHIHLTKHSFWKRVKYLFGYKSRFGCFEEFIFYSKDADKLQEIVNKLKKQ